MTMTQFWSAIAWLTDQRHFQKKATGCSRREHPDGPCTPVLDCLFKKSARFTVKKSPTGHSYRALPHQDIWAVANILIPGTCLHSLKFTPPCLNTMQWFSVGVFACLCVRLKSQDGSHNHAIEAMPVFFFFTDIAIEHNNEGLELGSCGYDTPIPTPVSDFPPFSSKQGRNLARQHLFSVACLTFISFSALKQD